MCVEVLADCPACVVRPVAGGAQGGVAKVVARISGVARSRATLIVLHALLCLSNATAPHPGAVMSSASDETSLSGSQRPSKRCRYARARGPLTSMELHEWAPFYVSEFVRAGRAVHLRHNILRGVELSTSYSGMGCAEMAAEMIMEGCISAGLVGVHTFTSYCAMDISNLCRRALQSHEKGPLRPHHVFGDVLDLLPPGALNALQAMEMEFQLSYIADGHEEAALAFVRQVFAVLAAVADYPAPHLYCHNCQKLCCADSRSASGHGLSRPLRVMLAGSTCIAFSGMGKRSQWAHDSAVPCLAWMWSLRRSQPHFVIHECTPLFTDLGLRLPCDSRHFVLLHVRMSAAA